MTDPDPDITLRRTAPLQPVETEKRWMPRKMRWYIVPFSLFVLVVFAAPPALFWKFATDPNWGDFWGRVAQPYATITAGLAALTAGALAFWNGERARTQAGEHETARLTQSEGHESSRRKADKASSLHDRFSNAVTSLADENPVIRLAGANLIASLSDEWTSEADEEQARVCLEVLVAYLRRPNPDPDEHSPDVPVRTAIAFLLSKRLADGKWVNTKSGEKADLRGLDLAFTDLAGINFGGCRLDRLNANSANLSAATFEGAALVEAILTGTNMYDARLAKSKLRRTNFESAQWRNTNFDGADMSYTKIRYVNGRPSASTLESDFVWGMGGRISLSFKETDLQWAEMDSSDLDQSDFSGAHLLGVRMSCSTFAQSIFDEATLHFARIRRCNFTESDLTKLAVNEDSRRTTNWADSLTKWAKSGPPSPIVVDDEQKFPNHFAEPPERPEPIDGSDAPW